MVVSLSDFSLTRFSTFAFCILWGLAGTGCPTAPVGGDVPTDPADDGGEPVVDGGTTPGKDANDLPDAGNPPASDGGTTPAPDAGGSPGDAGSPPVDGGGSMPVWLCPAAWQSDPQCDCGCGAPDPACGDEEPAECTFSFCGAPGLAFSAVDLSAHWLCPALDSAFVDMVEDVNAASGAEKTNRLEAFIAERGPNFPYVEGVVVSWLWRGQAQSVQLAGDITGWQEPHVDLLRLQGTDAWYLTTSLPLGARIDYKLIVDGEWILDPSNPAEAPSGFGPNSELSMPGWSYPGEIDFDASIPHGSIEGVTVGPGATYPPQRFSSTVLNNTRNVWIYRPPNYSDENQYPILYVHDGGEYMALAKMPNVLDNLIASGEIEPLVVAFVDPVNRGPEYVGNQVPSFVNLMVNELVPWVEAQVSVRGAADRGVMGTSNGGYISARLGRDHPEVFQKIASQSGALRADGNSLITSYANGVGIERIYVDTGNIADFIEANRSFRSVLENSNTNHTYAEYPEGHSWGLWRANLDELLRYLFPAP